jgi:hypothetical protein
VALSYPDNTIWYVRSSTIDGKEPAEGSAVAIRLQKREQPQTAKSYLLTCGHVVRGANDRKRVIHAWPPDVGYNPTQSRRLNIDTEFKDLPNGELSEAERRNAADDWVILKFEDGQAISGIDVVRRWAGDNVFSGHFRIWGYAGGDLSFSQGKVIPTKTADTFPFRDVAQGSINLTGDGARPGISGGGVFSVANGQFAGLHRGRLDVALQVSAVSSLHIWRRLYELGYEPVTLAGAGTGPNGPDTGAKSDLTTGIEQLDADYAHRIGNFIADYLGTSDRPVTFAGRANWLKLLDTWLATQNGPRFMVLTVPAGRGKSALVVRWCDQLAHLIQRMAGIRWRM